MIEPSDVHERGWRHDPSPYTPPPEPGTFYGEPQFLDKPTPEQMDLYVGDTYELTTRMKGERPITIEFQQKIKDDEGETYWWTITSFKLVNDQLGFTLKVPLKNSHIGNLKLRYIASNSQTGTVILKQKLKVHWRCACS